MKKYTTEKDFLELGRQIELFMKYIEKNDIPKKDNKIRFSDLDETVEVDLYIYPWMISQLHFHLFSFKIGCEFYKDKYPNAYAKISLKIEKRINFLPREKKVERLMQYIETNDIPNSKQGIRFCDIFSDTKNTTDVGIWIQDQLESNETAFFNLCQKYQDKYPTAYLKILHKWKKRNTNEVEDARMELFLQYTEFNKIKGDTRFCDIDKTSVDTTLVTNWLLSKLLKSDLEELKSVCSIYQKKYPTAVQLLTNRITKIQEKREQPVLSDEDRMKYFLNYLNEEKNVLNLDFRFHQLEENIKDSTIIRSWIKAKFFNDIEEFNHICSKYKDIYPIGYLRLMKIKDQYFKNSFKLQNLLSYEDKMKALLMFLERTEHIKLQPSLTFADIYPDCLDSSNVKIWICANMSKDLQKFIQVLEQEKNTYPIGYEKVVTIVNNSKVRLNKERNLFIEQLKQIRDSFQESSKTLKRIKK